MYDWVRAQLGDPIAAAAVAGVAYLALVVAVGAVAGWLPPTEALVPPGDSLVSGLLYRLAGTAGIVLLGAVPVYLYGRAGLVAPAVAPVALVALLGYTAGSESFAVLVFFYPPFFLAGAVAVGIVEYAVRHALAGGVGSVSPLVLAAAAGLVHAAAVTAALELLGQSYLADGALGVALVGPGLVLAVAGPAWLFSRLGLVGPVVGTAVGAALVVAAAALGDIGASPVEAYAELSSYVFFVALLFGAVEYAVRGAAVGSTPG